MSLSVVGIEAYQGQQQVLKDVTLTVKPGERIAVIGQNGAGKSTLLKCMTGELTPKRGKVLLNKKPIQHWDDEERAQLMAVLPQKSTLGFDFLVEEVVAFGRYPHNTSHRHNQKLIKQALEHVELSHYRQRHYTQLSGGEQQRVQLARVLVQIWEQVELGHRYLLLDEPTNALDLHHQEELFKQVSLFARQGIGVLFILHDVNLAARHADQVAIVHQGVIANLGHPRDVLTEQALAECFGLQVAQVMHPTLQVPQFIPL
ncbi:heme ABC transporter ATP-binding protein [Salinibius halmophilus]|uniref:heme ABC transporter ATP-binding protein n=1 Tax=Salinibius halmophilus TaxID=1853216 RepID=UPI000E663AE6|nr:heme ABC transporter ATP-binding protein [Salinibius halmophilus]